MGPAAAGVEPNASTDAGGADANNGPGTRLRFAMVRTGHGTSRVLGMLDVLRAMLWAPSHASPSLHPSQLARCTEPLYIQKIHLLAWAVVWQVCASNMNRSMEAHAMLKKAGLCVGSYGVGGHVKLPGPSAREPNV